MRTALELGASNARRGHPRRAWLPATLVVAALAITVGESLWSAARASAPVPPTLYDKVLPFVTAVVGLVVHRRWSLIRNDLRNTRHRRELKIRNQWLSWVSGGSM